MKITLLSLVLFLALSASAQTVAVVTIHGTGSQQFFVSTPDNGYYEIHSTEIWLNPDGSESFLTPTYTAVPAPVTPHGPMPTGRMFCSGAKLMMANSTGGSAECGPTISTQNDALGVRMLSCHNSDQWTAKSTPLGRQMGYQSQFGVSSCNTEHKNAFF